MTIEDKIQAMGCELPPAPGKGGIYSTNALPGNSPVEIEGIVEIEP